MVTVFSQTRLCKINYNASRTTVVEEMPLMNSRRLSHGGITNTFVIDEMPPPCVD
jgi:hypothetical protein